MKEPVLEIRFAFGWLKFYCVIISFIIFILITLAILDLDSFSPAAALLITIPFFIALISLGLKAKNNEPQLIFSESGIKIPLGLKRVEFVEDDSLIQGEKNLFASWAIVRDAEFVNGRGGTAISLSTDEDEAWLATRGFIPIGEVSAFRKYIFNAGNLELEPSRIVSIIKRLAETPAAERKNLLLHFSKNLI